MEFKSLEECILITSKEYCELNNPQWEGQTMLDENNQYYMICSCNGIYYKTLNTL